MTPTPPSQPESVRPRPAQKPSETAAPRTGLGWQPCLFFVDEETGQVTPYGDHSDHATAADAATDPESGYDLEQGW
ncbi:MAG: hypothetical protein U0Q19_10125 [Kineosporiaceae bacterium]